MSRPPLGIYVLGVIVVLALVNAIAWFVGGQAKLTSWAAGLTSSVPIRNRCIALILQVAAQERPQALARAITQ